MNIMQQDRGGADVVIAPQGKAPSVTVYTDGRNLQIPTTRDQMLALTARRDQLNEQLESVTDRRSDIIEQMRTAPNPAMQGLQAQLAALDSRVLQLEGDLATTGQEIAAASPELISIMGDSPREDTNGSFDDGVGAGVAGTFVTMSLLFFLGFRWWKKSARRRAPPLVSPGSGRLQGLEAGMGAVAGGIEGIPGGQRVGAELAAQARA